MLQDLGRDLSVALPMEIHPTAAEKSVVQLDLEGSARNGSPSVSVETVGIRELSVECVPLKRTLKEKDVRTRSAHVDGPRGAATVFVESRVRSRFAVVGDAPVRPRPPAGDSRRLRGCRRGRQRLGR